MRDISQRKSGSCFCFEMCLHRSLSLTKTLYVWVRPFTDIHMHSDLFFLFLKKLFTDVWLHAITGEESHPIKATNSAWCLHSCLVQRGPSATQIRRELSHKAIHPRVPTAPHLPLMSAQSWPQHGTSPPSPTAVCCVPPVWRLKNAKNEACCGAPWGLGPGFH